MPIRVRLSQLEHSTTTVPGTCGAGGEQGGTADPVAARAERVGSGHHRALEQRPLAGGVERAATGASGCRGRRGGRHQDLRDRDGRSSSMRRWASSR